LSLAHFLTRSFFFFFFSLFPFSFFSFRRDWVKAGGSTDDYFMDTMPNYGIVGALLLTISIPSVLDPPSFGFNGDGEASSKDNPAVQLFVRPLSLISHLTAKHCRSF
jgi:hypothetical protein